MLILNIMGILKINNNFMTTNFKRFFSAQSKNISSIIYGFLKTLTLIQLTVLAKKDFKMRCLNLYRKDQLLLVLTKKYRLNPKKFNLILENYKADFQKFSESTFFSNIKTENKLHWTLGEPWILDEHHMHRLYMRNLKKNIKNSVIESNDTKTKIWYLQLKKSYVTKSL